MSWRGYVETARRRLGSWFAEALPSPSVFDGQARALTGPNRTYKKFIVLGHQRSGSSLVIRSLRAHPQVVGFGELFLPDRCGFNIEGYDERAAVLLRARNAFPVEFLERYVFSGYLSDKRAVGFKLFPDQLDNDRFRCVWDWVERERDLAIVLLNRRDRLATYTSLLVAKKAGRYAARNDSDRPTATVTIDIEACLAEFEKRDRYEAIARAYSAHCDRLELTYEELNADPRAHLQRVQAFLGLDRTEPAIGSVKSEVRPLSEAIENYRELRETLARTKWASSLEED